MYGLKNPHVFIQARRQEAPDDAVKLIVHNVTTVQGDATELDDLDRLYDGRDEGTDRLWSIARRAAQDAGRDPDALKTAMRINLEPGTSVGSLADKLQRYAESGVDEAFFDAFAVFTSLDQMLDFASQVIARTGRL